VRAVAILKGKFLNCFVIIFINLLYFQESTNSMTPFKEVVKKFICIPATSCESERAFSKAGQIISDRRTRLKPDVVDKLMFINKNYSFLKNV